MPVDPHANFLSCLETSTSKLANPNISERIFSGFEEIDNLVGGFYPREMVIVGGYPRMGKLDFCLQLLVESAISQNKRVLIINFRHPDLIDRMIKSLSSKRANEDGSTTSSRYYNEAKKILASKAIGFVDWSKYRVNPRDLYARLKKEIYNFEPACILVNDIQQIVQTVNTNMYAEVSMVGRALHRISREFYLVTFALSKLNRRTLYSEKTSPELWSLSDAGCLEEDASTILLLHSDEILEGKPLTKGVEVNIAKSPYLPMNKKLYLHYERSINLFI